MSTPIEANLNTSVSAAARSAKSAKTRKKTHFFLFFIAWMILISSGVVGTMYYTDHLKQQLSAELAQQTQLQLQQMQAQYEQQLAQLKDSVNADIGALQEKVDSFNQLLAFTRDSANNRTDNSNQLYTQLQEVKNKLNELQRNLEVLK